MKRVYQSLFSDDTDIGLRFHPLNPYFSPSHSSKEVSGIGHTCMAKRR